MDLPSLLFFVALPSLLVCMALPSPQGLSASTFPTQFVWLYLLYTVCVGSAFRTGLCDSTFRALCGSIFPTGMCYSTFAT